MKDGNSQHDSALRGKFAARLREERARITPKQGDFAALVGIKQNTQSALEMGTNELRADYLASVAAHGIDITYVITGERRLTDLQPDEVATIYALRLLPEDVREPLVALIRAARERCTQGDQVRAQRGGER